MISLKQTNTRIDAMASPRQRALPEAAFYILKSAGKIKIEIKIRDMIEQHYLAKYAPNRTGSKLKIKRSITHIPAQLLLAAWHRSCRERVAQHCQKYCAA